MIALAAIDKKVHVRAMRTLALLLLSEELVKRLMSAGSNEEIYAVFEDAEIEDDN